MSANRFMLDLALTPNTVLCLLQMYSEYVDWEKVGTYEDCFCIKQLNLNLFFFFGYCCILIEEDSASNEAQLMTISFRTLLHYLIYSFFSL